MKARLRARRISLARDEVMTLEAACGHVLRCVEGAIWLTTGDLPGDHVLETGQSFTIPGRSRLVIEALRPASIAFVAPERPAPGETPLPSGLRWPEPICFKAALPLLAAGFTGRFFFSFRTGAAILHALRKAF